MSSQQEVITRSYSIPNSHQNRFEIVNFIQSVACTLVIFQASLGFPESSTALCLDSELSFVYLLKRLVDVPEMKYLHTDLDEAGERAPRGEIYIRGPGCTKAYYKNEQSTQETIDKDGWLITGDVGLIRKDGSLKIIDRVKNFFKLAQGEYIAPEKIQNVYASVEGVADSFVHGDPTRAHLVAIIVPDQSWVKKYSEKNNLSGTFEELCNNQSVVKAILANLESAGKKEALNSLERVKAIHLEPVPFFNRGICTSTLKVIRFEAKKYYNNILDELYKQ